MTYPDIVVDLSHWQVGPSGPSETVGFSAMAGSGARAVLLKATQGSNWVDATFVGRAMAAQAAGLLVGAYHFADATNPITQVNHFLNVAGGLPKLAVDIETNGIGDTVSVRQAAELVSRIHMATGLMPLVYIGRYGPDDRGSGLPNPVLSRCPLWIPHYSGGGPVLPNGWNTWSLWQYTDTGSCPGVGGACDRNYFNGSADELFSWWSAP